MSSFSSRMERAYAAEKGSVPISEKGSVPISGGARTRREDARELVGRRRLELIVAAVFGGLIGAPAQERCGVPKAVALQMVVFHFADAFGSQRLPRKILLRAPAAMRARHAARFRARARPVAPW